MDEGWSQLETREGKWEFDGTIRNGMCQIKKGKDFLGMGWGI